MSTSKSKISEDTENRESSGPRSEANTRLEERRNKALAGADFEKSGVLFQEEWCSFSDDEAKKYYETKHKRTGLALSGGGIRSATISLGFCEALATRGRLYGFDMLSTVSGGGYFGTFMRSLFVPRIGADEKSSITDRRLFADATLESRPDKQYFRGKPGNSTFVKDKKVIKNPLWWLRENGRYLAPRGTTDHFFGLVYIIRNWFSLMLFLVGIAVVAFSLLQLLLVGAEYLIQYLSEQGPDSLQKYASQHPLTVLLALGATITAGIAGAYWLSIGWPYFRVTMKEFGFWKTLGALVAPAIAATILIAIVLLHCIGRIPDDEVAQFWAFSLEIALGSALIFSIFCLPWGKEETYVDFRRKQTKLLSQWCVFLIMIFLLAVVDQTSLWLRPTLDKEPWGEIGTTSAISGVIASVLSVLIAKIPDFNDGNGSWIASFVMKNAKKIAFVAAALILLAIAILADTLVIKLLWKGDAGSGEIQWGVFGPVFALIGLVTVLFARSKNFANLSALTPLYGSRLTRTFLGGSNVSRLDTTFHSQITQGRNDDDILLSDYMKEHCAAPLHLINVTRNRTIGEPSTGEAIDTENDDPLVVESKNHSRGRLASYESSLTLHDRHGDRMVFGPFGMRVGGKFFRWNQLEETPSLGLLCAISGAAVGAGMGRLTSLGTSMALTLANIRLGFWWKEQRKEKTGDAKKQKEANQNSSTEQPPSILSKLLPGLSCLGNELFGRFGTKKHWFLSDGGHSENTGVLTLLERGCRFIVACDNGQDKDYAFGDLEILIRSARTDIGMEVKVVDHDDFPDDFKTIHEHFLNGTKGDWREYARSKGHTGFALLLKATDIALRVNGDWDSRDDSSAWIIWIKPTCFADLPADLRAYAEQNTDYPQQSTSNQFFDEAQWESYRRLGFEMGDRLFKNRDAFVNQLPLIISEQSSESNSDS